MKNCATKSSQRKENQCAAKDLAYVRLMSVVKQEEFDESERDEYKSD